MDKNKYIGTYNFWVSFGYANDSVEDVVEITEEDLKDATTENEMASLVEEAILEEVHNNIDWGYSLSSTNETTKN